jgi:lipopolysaccharide biosynthesis glycosyltransferase
LFLDADMVVKGDIAEVFQDFDAEVAMQIEQAQFEWASAMLFNCALCKNLTPEYVDNKKNIMFDFFWAKRVAHLPPEWNHCVGYEKPAPAKLYHYTQGVPIWAETRGVEDAPFLSEAKAMLHTVSWQELMGNSVHAEHVQRRLNQPAVSG